MKPHIHMSLRYFAKLVKDAYGDDFADLVVFGSHARDEATEESDIDVGVILKTVTDKRLVREKLADLAYDVLLDTGEDIQAVAISLDQWEAPQTFSNPSLIQAMKIDGVAMGAP